MFHRTLDEARTRWCHWADNTFFFVTTVGQIVGVAMPNGRPARADLHTLGAGYYQVSLGDGPRSRVCSMHELILGRYCLPSDDEQYVASWLGTTTMNDAVVVAGAWFATIRSWRRDRVSRVLGLLAPAGLVG